MSDNQFFLFISLVVLMAGIVINSISQQLFKYLGRKKAVAESIVRVLDQFLNVELHKLVHRIKYDMVPAETGPGDRWVAEGDLAKYNIPPSSAFLPVERYVVGLSENAGVFLLSKGQSSQPLVEVYWRQNQDLHKAATAVHDQNGNAKSPSAILNNSLSLGDRITFEESRPTNLSYSVISYRTMVSSYFRG